jgi:hypothetical protein
MRLNTLHERILVPRSFLEEFPTETIGYVREFVLVFPVFACWVVLKIKK